MNLKTLLRAISIKYHKKRKTKFWLIKSYVSLFLVLFLAISSVAAWFTSVRDVTLTSNTLSMNGAAGMRNDKSKKVIDEVKIPAFTLDEASSVDGRNIYIPTTSSSNASDANHTNIDTETNSLIYREANAGDRDKRYAYAEIALSGSSRDTKVWIRSYSVKIGDDVYEDKLNVDDGGAGGTSGELDRQIATKDCPVRIAIISDSGDDPKVIDPSALVPEYAINTNSVYYINVAGSPRTKPTNLETFSAYYYGTNNPLFVLDQDETKEVAFVAWLEGSHPKAADYVGQTMSIDIEIETNVSDMGYIYFHDWTANDNAGTFASSEYKTKAAHWLSRDNAIIAVSYYDEFAQTTKTTVMTKMTNGQVSDDGYFTATDDYTYMAAIPLYVETNISFYRLASMDAYLSNPAEILKGNIYNAWHTKSGINNSLSTTAKLTTAESRGLTNIYNVDESARKWVKNFGLGGLAESRVVNEITSYHYYAIRGNAYGSIPSNNTYKYLYWLSPCVGYWGDYQGNLYDNSSEIPTSSWTT